MNHLTHILLLLTASVSAALAAPKTADDDSQTVYLSTSFREPATDGLRFIRSSDGVHWTEIEGTFLTPLVGKQKVMRDPSVCQGPDGTYHLVWTSSWRGDRGFGYASSRDLIHWSEQRFLTAMSDTTTVNCWAPELFYDDVKRQFVIVWASCVPSRKFDLGQEDPKNNHRLYYTTTRDFRHLAPARLLYDPGFSSIDATLVKVAKGDYAMVFKDNTRPQLNIRVARAATPYGPWGKPTEPITEKYCEGPAVCQVGPWWYIYYDSYRRKIFGAARTKDFRTFQDQTGAVHLPAGHKHGTIFRASRQIADRLTAYNRDKVRLTSPVMATPSRHDGGLAPVAGVHCIQTMRASRGWTYNHQPMLTRWRNRFYCHYLTDPRSEHEAPGRTMLITSDDGYTWTRPVVLFPEYLLPDGYEKEGVKGRTSHTYAVMHQRVGFYTAKDGRLLATGNYGVVLNPKDDPNDGHGVGRVVREIYADGSFGPIYFIYYNHAFSERNTLYPNYRRSRDKGFVRACDELIADPLMRMSWVEEADRGDKLIPLNKPYKAFSYYTLDDGRTVGLWKHALQSISLDRGATWREPATRAHGFVNSNAKIWGQRLSDGLFATVYNPAEFRWPLAISLSADGLEYTTLNLLDGDVTPLRHGGNYKSYGPQYVRGVSEMNTQPEDGHLWLAYSMNKEDLWAARVTVPVATEAASHADGTLPEGEGLAPLTRWNIHSALWAPVSRHGQWITLADRDPYDYARVERVIPATRELQVEFDLRASQTDRGRLDIEFADSHGTYCSRLTLDSLGTMSVKGGARYGTLLKHYDRDSVYHVSVTLSCDLHQATYSIGSHRTVRMFDTPVESISRVIFRTGSTFSLPDIETPADQDFDLPRADEEDPLAIFEFSGLKTRESEAGYSDNYVRTLCQRFDADEKAYAAHDWGRPDGPAPAADIPNSEAEQWLCRNVPQFDCPDPQMREIYYFRWWSLRKHLERTPAGWGMTEFLVPRSYADHYNLIACAIGHHVMETRWLRDSTYLHQILRTWYRGNDGGPMAKMMRFSSWNPAAVYEMYKTTGDSAFALSLLPDLEAEYARWQQSHRLPSGLYWQADVQDGMEESLSGGRKKQYARPTINSYMYGNAVALSRLSALAGHQKAAARYAAEADTLARLVNSRLWNASHQFFETLRGDSTAAVREAIGFLPWYFNMPVDKARADSAWAQLTDPKGFSAPYGLTTAERRHPDFRSHGSGRCEWDGAIWPFATSQTLTALINHEADSLSSCGDNSPIAQTFFRQMTLYAQCQYHRGQPYIGEYLDETTGAWLMGDRERSRYYNHSTFADLVITGLCGLRPQADGSIVVRPLGSCQAWDWWQLKDVSYHGRRLTITWDRTGNHYHQGRGLTVRQTE